MKFAKSNPGRRPSGSEDGNWQVSCLPSLSDAYRPCDQRHVDFSTFFGMFSCSNWRTSFVWNFSSFKFCTNSPKTKYFFFKKNKGQWNFATCSCCNCKLDSCACHYICWTVPAHHDSVSKTSDVQPKNKNPAVRLWGRNWSTTMIQTFTFYYGRPRDLFLYPR